MGTDKMNKVIWVNVGSLMRRNGIGNWGTAFQAANNGRGDSPP
jgi:hypothetical protein